MTVAQSLASEVNTRQACNALSIPRAGFYRWKHRDDKPDNVKIRPAPPLALSDEEDKKVMEILHSDRFVDMAPAEIHATLLDEGKYLCSPRTMYRKLEKHDEVRERRNQLRHPAYSKPELIAKAPNQVWSWDITKLKGPVKWTYFHLYVIMDIFSRYVVGWMIASQELSYLAKELIKQTCEKQGVQRDQLIIHSDRGTSMTSKTVALLMTDLGITKSLSRPHVSNDNPFSKLSSKHSSTVPSSRNASVALMMHESFLRDYSLGTTMFITIPALAIFLRWMSITVDLNRLSKRAAGSSGNCL